jgi:hypothetical protein
MEELLLETDLTRKHHRTLQHAAARSDRQDARCRMPRLGRLSGCWRSRFAGRLRCCRQLWPILPSERAVIALRHVHLHLQCVSQKQAPRTGADGKADHAIDCGARLYEHLITALCTRTVPAGHEIFAAMVAAAHAALIASLLFSRRDSPCACIFLFASLPPDLPISRVPFSM